MMPSWSLRGTSTQQVRDLSKVVGYGINWALQDLEIEEMNALLSWKQDRTQQVRSCFSDAKHHKPLKCAVSPHSSGQPEMMQKDFMCRICRCSWRIERA